MKIVYLDCSMGASGDMLTAALLELSDKPEDFIREINSAGIPNVSISADTCEKCGVKGTSVSVKVGLVEESADGENDVHHELKHHHEHSHEHHSLSDIETIIRSLNISESTKNNAIKIYKLIADAESKVHGESVSEIHFHEVGAMDAIADIVSVCKLIEIINPETVFASTVNTGSGTVKCAHGILPVPAPATKLLLDGIPCCCNEIKSELCTPTGAALLKNFVTDFCGFPKNAKILKIGYGMGKKNFEKANCLKAYLIEL